MTQFIKRACCGLAVGIALLALQPMTVQAQTAAAKISAGSPLPAWQAADVCKRDSVTDQCDLFEHRAAHTVSGSWAFLPEDVRAKCLADSAKPAAQSWRLLAGCIETSMGRNIDRKAVLTAKTPTEPVPPRKVAPVAPPEEVKTEIKPSDATTPSSTPAAAAAASPAPAAAVAPATASPAAPAASVPPAAAGTPAPEAKKP